MNHPIKRVEFVRKYLDGIFAEDVHAKRVMSLANGAVGVMTGASLAVSIIGQSAYSDEAGHAFQHEVGRHVGNFYLSSSQFAVGSPSQNQPVAPRPTEPKWPRNRLYSANVTMPAHPLPCEIQDRGQ